MSKHREKKVSNGELTSLKFMKFDIAIIAILKHDTLKNAAKSINTDSDYFSKFLAHRGLNFQQIKSIQEKMINQRLFKTKHAGDQVLSNNHEKYLQLTEIITAIYSTNTLFDAAKLLNLNNHQLLNSLAEHLLTYNKIIDYKRIETETDFIEYFNDELQEDPDFITDFSHEINKKELNPENFINNLEGFEIFSNEEMPSSKKIKTETGLIKCGFYPAKKNTSEFPSNDENSLKHTPFRKK